LPPISCLSHLRKCAILKKIVIWINVTMGLAMIDESASALVQKIQSRRNPKAKFYKPVCLISAAQVIGSSVEENDRVSARSVLKKFSDLVGPVITKSLKKGFRPFWALSSDGIWTVHKNDQLVTRDAFRQGSPSTESQLLEAVDYAKISPAYRQLFFK
jgi:hypothetical protein